MSLKRAVLAALIVSGILAQALAEEAKPFTQDIPDDLGQIEMLPVPAGSVTMDDPLNAGKTITKEIKPLFMSKFEIRWEIMDIFVYKMDQTEKETAAGVDAANRPSTPYIPPDRGMGHEGYPACSVSYQSAQKFCEWLSKKSGKHYRLPTEAEWYYACLAGDKQHAYTKEELNKVAVFKSNAQNPNTMQLGSAECGGKKANAWGFFDMLGNAGEYCVTGIKDDNKGVLRGGRWCDDVDACQPTSRAIPDASWQKTDPQNPKSKWWMSDAPWAGFRVVCEP